jgi:hypothetical protein
LAAVGMIPAEPAQGKKEPGTSGLFILRFFRGIT